MSKVVVQAIGVSLDGFAAGTYQSLENPLGVRGPELMEWFFPTKTFIEQHGASRFQDMDKLDATVHNRAGWRDSSGGVRYMFTASGMKEAIKGFDLTRAADVLIQCGALPARGADGKPTRLTKIDGVTVRVYPISPDYLREVDHGIA